MVTSGTAQFFATGMISWSMKFTYKDGKVKRTASQFTPIYEKNVKNWTAQRNLNLYQQLGSKTLAYTIKNGDVSSNKQKWKNRIFNMSKNFPK